MIEIRYQFMMIITLVLGSMLILEILWNRKRKAESYYSILLALYMVIAWFGSLILIILLTM